MLKLEAFASQPHYLEHLAPIWNALDQRGEFFMPPRLLPRAAELGISGTACDKPQGRGPLMVAGLRDMLGLDRPIVHVEHGAGQTYGRRMGAYPGGRGRENVVLFVCPSERVAELNRRWYPAARAVAVGCPRMDRLHRERSSPVSGRVAFAFHWNAAGVAPEACSAWRHYERVVEKIAGAQHVLGHGHPRMWGKLEPWYRRIGAEPVSAERVLREAAVLVVDNSSIGWEFLSLDRPVVWLNLPTYRRDVEHGLRFWEFADAGVQVDQPSALAHSIELALADPEQVRARRRTVIPQVYAATDGKAAERAAEAVMDVLKGAQHG